MKIAHKSGIYLYALFLLLCNASVFWGVKWGNELSVVAFIFSWIFAFWKRNLNRIQLKKFVLITSLFLIANVINIRNRVNWTSAFLFIAQLWTICTIQSFVDIKKIHRAIVNSMFLICVVSLITFCIKEMGSALLDRFIVTESIHGSSYKYIYSVWHTFGWNVDFHRNAGPYWEAGMFACYISITFFLILFEENLIEPVKKKILYSTVYIITLLSTLSTTAYLTLGIFAIYFYIILPKQTKKQWILKFCMFIFAVVCLFLLISSEVVQNKIFTSNSSIIKRTANLANGIKLVLDNPLFGLGFRSDRSRELEFLYEAGSAANGLVQGAYRMGLLVFATILFYYKKGLNIVVGSKVAFLGILLFAFLMFCEPIQIFLFFLSFIFVNYRIDRVQRESMVDTSS